MQPTPEDVVDEAVTAMEVDRGPILDEQPVVDEATILSAQATDVTEEHVDALK
jgi:hypothetical protein